MLKQQRRYRAATRSRRYGAALEQDLVELNLEHGDVAEADRAALAASSGTDAGLLGVTDLAFSAHGYISSSTHSSKKPTFILFVNDRLVESSALRRTVDAAFAETLPRGAHPWVSIEKQQRNTCAPGGDDRGARLASLQVYLALTVPRRHIDVNVHPTKQEARRIARLRLLRCGL